VSLAQQPDDPDAAGSGDPEPGRADDAGAELTFAESAGGPTALRILLGSQLRALREAAGISPDGAGYEIRASRSKISRVEHGRSASRSETSLTCSPSMALLTSASARTC